MTYTKPLLILLAALACVLTGHAQSEAPAMQKPKVMVVPEEAFCINKGYVREAADGSPMADYTRAMLDNDVLDVINSFENIMAGYGFELTNLSQTLDELKEDEALTGVLTAKDDGMVVEDDLDRLSRVAGADILVKVAPRISAYGPEQRLELRVSSIDCASKKALLAFGPVSKTSAGSVSMLLRAAVSDNIETFAMGLNRYFEQLKTKGREGTIFVKVAETCPLNLESTVTYRGEEGELADLIQMWVADNAVRGAFTGGKTSRYAMKLDQVRFPLTGKAAFGRVKALSMEDFVKTGLTALLGQYDISVSTHAVGIGKVYLTLGKKD